MTDRAVQHQILSNDFVPQYVDSPWNDLAHAVITQGLLDYAQSLVRLEKDPKDKTGLQLLDDTTRFFSSRYCNRLTQMNVPELMKAVERSVAKHERNMSGSLKAQNYVAAKPYAKGKSDHV